MRLSVADLKYFVEQHHGIFFNSKSLQHNGDTLENFAVKIHPVSIIANCGNMKLCWELYRKTGKPGSFYFDVETYEQHFKKEIICL